jgi:arylsulfatase A-like enzyme
MYGSDATKTPFLQEIAKDSYVFEKAISPSSWTAPSTASLFTGVFPSQHGVITGFVITKRLKKQKGLFKYNRLPRSLKTLPELFKEQGYTTIGGADNQNIGPEFGFDRGFDSLATLPYKTARVLNEHLSKSLENIDPKKPLFLYIHYMDPHSPYHRRAPWYVPGKDKRSDSIQRYKSEIEFVDHHFKALVDKFPRLKDAVFVITSDHGEQFWEHGRRGHGKSLHRQETHIPLFIRFPRKNGQTRIKEPVSLVDIIPTFAEMLKSEPDPRWAGKSLVPLLKDKDTGVRSAYSELLFVPELKERASYRSMLVDDTHIIERVDKDEGIKAFSWKEDLRQENPKFLESTDWSVEFMRSYIKGLQMLTTEEGEMVLDDAHIERLKTLGYVM